jgi:aspartate kinase
MIVMKFGGSSLESRESIERVARIVASAKERHPLVVVSAMGKTTNRLIAMAEASELGARDKSETLLSELREDTLALAKSSSTPDLST